MSSDRNRGTVTPRKRPTPEEIVRKLRQVDVLVSQGKSVADAVRSIGTTNVPERRICKVLGQHRSTQRLIPTGKKMKNGSQLTSSNSLVSMVAIRLKKRVS